MSAYVPNQATMGLLFIAVLLFAAVTGFQAWPYYWPIFLYAGYWALYLKLMPEEDRRILKSARGAMLGLFVGRGLVVAFAFVLGTVIRNYL